jgi:hypothetical protein
MRIPACLAAAGAFFVFASPALAVEEAALSLTIKDHKFSPAEIKAPANTPIVITIQNADATPEEFESKQLKFEKVIAGGASATVRLRPLAPGRYGFFGEYHEDSAKGVLVVE